MALSRGEVGVGGTRRESGSINRYYTGAARGASIRKERKLSLRVTPSCADVPGSCRRHVAAPRDKTARQSTGLLLPGVGSDSMNGRAADPGALLPESLPRCPP